MKINFLVSLFLAFSLFAKAEQPQKVVSLVKQAQTDEWYETQAGLWQQRIKANDKDADAWLNYYTASRMLKIQAKTRTQDDLNKIVSDMEKAIPNSFEYHYVVYWNEGASEAQKNFHHLEKAYEIAPNRPETYDDFFTYYMLVDNQPKLAEISEKWLNSNDISTGIYAWNYNMLMSCEPNSVLIVNGDNDTYPALILQMAKNVRPDVIVMNNSLLLVDSYRQSAFAKAGISPIDLKWENFESYDKLTEALYVHMISDLKDRSLYFGMGFNTENKDFLKDKVYNVGLAWKYSEDKFDNIAVMKKNFEKVYLLDYLKQSFESDISQGVVNHMSSNYLAAMLVLYNHYLESEDAKAEALKSLIDQIASANNMTEQVSEILGASKNTYASKTITDLKQIMELFVKINDTTYAMKNEVSNELYGLFLQDLVLQKRFDDLAIAQNEAVNWRSLLTGDAKKLKDSELFLIGNPDDPKFPAVNMSYEAAQLFCQWLGEVYNPMQDRKKPSEKATFRLPGSKEWEMLALGGKTKRAYAWNGPYLRNSKGCFLANLDVSDVENKSNINEPCPSCNDYNLDGGIFTVPVSSYLANEFGLYNMTGNVAEMVSEKGKSKGGSWNTKGGVATIESSENYTGANPYTGFRVIMIIR